MEEYIYKTRVILKTLFFICLLVSYPLVSHAAKPVILYTDIVSGPNKGGENDNGCYLSIFGKNFGNNINAIEVHVGNGKVARKMYLGPSARPDIQRISVQLGHAVTSGPIKLVVDGQESNTDHSFTIRPGNIYFVSLNGNNSTGVVNDINKPYRAPNYFRYPKSNHNFSPGDFIVIRGGTYDLDNDIENLGGSPSAFITMSNQEGGEPGKPKTFMGYPGEEVIIKKGGKLWVIYATRTSHLVFANLNVVFPYDSVSLHAIRLGVSSLPCRRCCMITDDGTYDCTKDKYVCEGDNKCDQCKVVYYSDEYVGQPFSYGRIVNIDISKEFGKTWGSQVYISTGHHVQVLGLSIHDFRDADDLNTLDVDEGYSRSHPLYIDGANHDTELGWCTIYNYERSRALIQLHTDNYSGCFDYKSITDIHIHDCLIHHVNGQVILLGGGTGDIYIYNNIIYASPDKIIRPSYYDVIALRATGGHAHPRLYNNTIYVNPRVELNGWIMQFGFEGYIPEHVTLKNNIFYVTEAQDEYWYEYSKDWDETANVTSSNNIWYGSSKGLPPFAGSNDRILDPKFVNAKEADFHLRFDSPCIDKGTSDVKDFVKKGYEGNPRPQHNGYDIGAYEYIVPPVKNVRKVLP